MSISQNHHSPGALPGLHYPEHPVYQQLRQRVGGGLAPVLQDPKQQERPQPDGRRDFNGLSSGQRCTPLLKQVLSAGF